LSNHGIVCWADTVTHAEWYAEVLETYCWTLMIASQLGVPISQISQKQGDDLLAIKKKLGLPDIRFDASRMKECQLSDLEVPGSIALAPTPCDGPTGRSAATTDGDLESLVKSVTDAVMDAMGK
jgi:L-fuculose-phosphate aldolase